MRPEEMVWDAGDAAKLKSTIVSETVPDVLERKLISPG